MTLSASGLPAGATASFNPSTVTAGGSSTLTISLVSSTLVGSYALTVTGTGASAMHSTSVSLTVTVPDDFSISASPSSVTVVQGQSVTSADSNTIPRDTSHPMMPNAIFFFAKATASFNPSTVTAAGTPIPTGST